MDRPRPITRRKFIGGVVASTAGTVAAKNLLAGETTPLLTDDTNPLLTREAKGLSLTPTATDLVRLGQTSVKISRLGFGTGSRGGKVQRELGQKDFTRLLRYAIDRGITFIDTADNYSTAHEMIRPAIKDIARERIQIQCKIPHGKYDDPLKEIDRFRKEVGTDYFDSMLIHCVKTADWPQEQQRLMDLLLTAKDRGIVRAVGVSMHGLIPLRATAKTSWGDVRQVRINHNGTSMDNLKGTTKEPGDVDEVVGHVKKMHTAGKGIIAMKVIGNGNFTDLSTRRASIDFVMAMDSVDAAVIGFKSTGEIDEAIANINAALTQRKQLT